MVSGSLIPGPFWGGGTPGASGPFRGATPARHVAGGVHARLVVMGTERGYSRQD